MVAIAMQPRLCLLLKTSPSSIALCLRRSTLSSCFQLRDQPAFIPAQDYAITNKHSSLTNHNRYGVIMDISNNPLHTNLRLDEFSRLSATHGPNEIPTAQSDDLAHDAT